MSRVRVEHLTKIGLQVYNVYGQVGCALGAEVNAYYEKGLENFEVIGLKCPKNWNICYSKKLGKCLYLCFNIQGKDNWKINRLWELGRI